MEENLRSKYAWYIIILANIGTILTTMIMEAVDGCHNVLANFSDFLGGYFPIYIASILVSLIPMSISQSNLRWRHWLGFGILILLLIPIPYLYYDAQVCTEKFCAMFDYAFIYICAILSVIFLIVYLVGLSVRKWGVAFGKAFSWVLFTILICAIIFLFYQSFIVCSSLSSY